MDTRAMTANAFEHIESMPFEQAKNAVKAMLERAEFKNFADGNGAGTYPVAVANQALQQALGTSVKVVRLSSADRDKQVSKKLETGRSQYGLVQSMIDDGLILKYRDRAVSIYRKNGNWYHAAIQVTKAGDALYLKSLRRADASQIARDRARGIVVQESA